MIWKIGLAMLLAGIAVTLGGCVLLGTAISQAASGREVANLPLDVGTGDARTRSVHVARDKAVRLRLEARITVPEELIEETPDRSDIVEFFVPFNYEVTDPSGEIVHVQAGELRSSEIVPAKDGPHYASYDRTVTLTHESLRFDAPESGSIRARVELAESTRDGIPVESAAVRVIDRVSRPAPAATGGFVSVVLGPLLFITGMIVWIIGLFVAAGKPKRMQPSGA